MNPSARGRFNLCLKARGILYPLTPAQSIGFIDIDWKNYNFKNHLEIVKKIRPFMTVARDLEDAILLDQVISEAKKLSKYCSRIIIVPKDKKLKDDIEYILGKSNKFILGYSVPTGYGKTNIPVRYFKGPIHLLGGRPIIQRRIANHLNVVSIDCNSFTIDARYGKYFDGKGYTKVQNASYEYCIRMSILGINKLWDGYAPAGI